MDLRPDQQEEGDDGVAAEGGGRLISEAPTPRAKALRDEIFGEALMLDEAAYVLGLDKTTVAKYLRENIIVGFQIGREWLIPETELRAYVQRMITQRCREEGPFSEGTETRGEGKRHALEALVRSQLGRVITGPDTTATNLFDRFSTRGHHALILAHEEALRLDRDYVGSEHLLLGLLVEGKDVVTRALGSVDVDLERVRAAVQGRSGPHTQPSDRTKGGLTPDAIRVIVQAVDEAQRLGHQFADTEHVLLGLIRVAEDGGAGILGALGVNLGRARTAVLRLLLD